MAATDDEMNIIETTSERNDEKNETNNNNNNNFNTNENVKTLTTDNNNKDESGVQNKLEKRKKFFQQYFYQQNYQEALRSLLWEPYDCRNHDSNSWYYANFLDNEPKSVKSEVPKQNFTSLSESSVSSYSSYSSLDEILTVELTQKCALDSESGCNYNIEIPKEIKKKYSYVGHVKLGKDLITMKTKENNHIYIDNELGEEKDFACGFSEYRCSRDPVQNLMNLEIMVSDLEAQSGEGVSTTSGHYGAHKSDTKEICASGFQYEISCCEREVGVCRRDSKNVLSTVDNMLVTVEGTLEPRDSHEGTQLVSPDTSLDLNDNPIRLSGQNRGVEPGPSSGNVSVVNCYRAVPVSVVSTVPTIKCLNTQENISNVHIIQTSSSSEQKLSNSCAPVQPKRLPVRSDNVPNAGPNGAGQCGGPSTSRARTKVPRDVSRIQNRHSVNGEQNAVIRATTKIERERPKSMNSCASEITSDQSNNAAPNLCESVPTSSSNNDSSILLSNHNRSVSNPVLGNQAKPISNRYGSHQNIPIRLETHFGPNSSDGTERSQTYVSQRIISNSDSHHQGQERAADQNAGGNILSSPRTYTSTEAQTDDVSLGIHPQINREQRRRERRERRHQRRLHQSVLNSGSVWQSNVDVVHRDRRGLPDILNSHMPPPYSAVPVPAIPAMPSPMHVPPPLPVAPGPQTMPHLVDSSPGQPLPHQNGLRFLFPFPGGRR